jgi:AICAR transformylase/IMP cyclohydrolase PurH
MDMMILTGKIVSISDANKSFNKVSKIAKKMGEAIIFKHNKPAFILLDVERVSNEFLKEYEKLKIKYLSNEIMDEYSDAYRELAK